ncbi:MAG: hypothetical protein F6K34_03430, partial [Okeania sp. SIO4D6]|nr:hypothetical protein [Okeania sp. SIO4D6]
GRRKKEEERGKREEGYPRKKKPSFPVDIHPWVYTNDINGHDIIGGAIAFWEEESDRFKALVIFLAYIR